MQTLQSLPPRSRWIFAAAALTFAFGCAVVSIWIDLWWADPAGLIAVGVIVIVAPSKRWLSPEWSLAVGMLLIGFGTARFFAAIFDRYN